MYGCKRVSTNFNSFVSRYQALEGFGKMQTVPMLYTGGTWKIAKLHYRSACGCCASTILNFWGDNIYNFIKFRITSECRKNFLQKFTSSFTFAKIGQSKLILSIATFHAVTGMCTVNVLSSILISNTNGVRICGIPSLNFRSFRKQDNKIKKLLAS